MSNEAKDYLKKKDAILQAIIERLTLPKIISTKNVFHDLMSCILEQQIHYRSTKKVFQKMLDAASMEILTPETFPAFEKKGFEQVKLATKKYETIIGIVDFFRKQSIDWQQKDDQEVRALLSQIKGVGHWTIDMILLYTLERQDIFPADDYHLKQIMAKQYNIDTTARLKAQMKDIAEEWSPYKSVAVKYLLAWKYFQKKAKR